MFAVKVMMTFQDVLTGEIKKAKIMKLQLRNKENVVLAMQLLQCLRWRLEFE